MIVGVLGFPPQRGGSRLAETYLLCGDFVDLRACSEHELVVDR